MTDRSGRRLFATGGVVLILLGLVHSFSLIHPMVPANDTEKQLLGLMSDYRFNLMGSLRSMGTLLRGFSISFMLWAIGLGALDLVLVRAEGALLKRVALINTFWLAAMTAISLRYFFAAPTSFLVVALILFALAWWELPGSSKLTASNQFLYNHSLTLGLRTNRDSSQSQSADVSRADPPPADFLGRARLCAAAAL
jgi:hypothetical protein